MEHKKNKPTLHFGVLGEKLGHSLSPEIHADLLKQQNINGTYRKYEMNEQEVLNLLDVMKADNILGMNVTMPYKETAYKLMDCLDTHAEKVGAVNTILMKNGLFYGYNTDHIGVVSMFHKAGVSLSKKTIVILGSGGAAKALIYGFHMAKAAKIIVAARNEEANLHLEDHFPYIETCSLSAIPCGDILINTTPVGMYPDTGVSPVDASVISQFSVAADIVYNPLMTEFLTIAKAQGLKVVTGLMMLVDQAIGSEEIWLDKTLDYNMGNRIHDELARKF